MKMAVLDLWVEEIFEGNAQTGGSVTIHFLGKQYTSQTWGGVPSARRDVLCLVAANLGVEYIPSPCDEPGDFIAQLRTIRGLVGQAFCESQNKRDG